MNLVRLLLALLVLNTTVGCASKSAAPDESTTQEITQVSFEARYNPAPCDCPPFEFLAGDEWVRAFVELDDMSKLDALREAAPLETVTVEGRLTTRERRAENGVDYPILKTP